MTQCSHDVIKNKSATNWNNSTIKTRRKKSGAAKQIYFYHSGPFPIVFLRLSPSIHPLFSLPVLYSSSGAVFPPLHSFPVFFHLSVSLFELMFGGISSRTPPLTDSLDGTLFCTVQCTEILPQWALDLWWMDGITPLTAHGTCQLKGGREGFPMWVGYTITGFGKLGPSRQFQVS